MNNSSGFQDVFENTNHVVAIIEVLIFIISVLGNSLVIVTVLWLPELRTTLNMLIVNLSVCDIIIVTFGIPFGTAEQYNQGMDYLYGAFGCRLINPLSTLGSNAAALALLWIAIERYVAIKYPMHWTESKNHTFKFILLTYIYGILTVIPYACHLEIVSHNGSPSTCDETWSTSASQAYTIFLFLIQYGLPLPAMIILYAKAWIYLKEQNEHTIKISEAQRKSRGASMISENHLNALRTRMTGKERSTSIISTSSYSQEVKRMCLVNCVPSKLYAMIKGKHNRHHLQSNVKKEEFIANGRRRQTIRTFLIFILIMVIFAVCSLPNQITWLFKVFAMDHSAELPKLTENIFYMLHYTNCVLNPWIYGGLNKAFKRGFKKILGCEKIDESSKRNVSVYKLPSEDDLFKDGIIIRSPVEFINCGSIDSIFDDVSVEKKEKKRRRVKFKLSTSSFGSRSFGSRSFGSKAKLDKELRKLSVNLVANRQRKLTLPNLTPSSSPKNPVRKYSVPLFAASTLAAFEYNDSLTLLPPAEETNKSSSLLSKLSSTTRRSRKTAIDQTQTFSHISIFGELKRTVTKNAGLASGAVRLNPVDNECTNQISFKEEDEDDDDSVSRRSSSTSESDCDISRNFSSLKFDNNLEISGQSDSATSENDSDDSNGAMYNRNLFMIVEDDTSIASSQNNYEIPVTADQNMVSTVERTSIHNFDIDMSGKINLKNNRAQTITPDVDTVLIKTQNNLAITDGGLETDSNRTEASASWQVRASCACNTPGDLEQYALSHFDFSNLIEAKESCI